MYLSYNKAPVDWLPESITQAPVIKEFTVDGVILANGEKLVVDNVIFATGYQFSAPFLSPNLPFSVKGKQVSPLYKHLVHIEHPSLFVVGLNYKGATLPMFDGQVQFGLALLSGKVKLPSREEMYQCQDEDVKWRIADGQHPHYFGPLMWQYLRELAAMGQFPVPFKAYMDEMYSDVDTERQKYPLKYKRIRYKVIDDNTFEKVYPDDF